MKRLKILWSLNVIIDEAANLMGVSGETTVTWMDQLVKNIRSMIDLTIIYPTNLVQKITRYDGMDVSFIALPRISSNGYTYEDSLTQYYIRVLSDLKPDAIEQWGSEFPNAWNLIQAADELDLLDRTAVYIQGLIGEISKEEVFFAALPETIVDKHSFKDFIRKNSLKEYRQKYLTRAEYEKLVLKKARHVIGRTGFDKKICKDINPEINYHHNNETLRPTFYSGEWTREKAVSHRVFISQGGMPYKGFHLALEGLGKLKNDYPDLTIAVTGRTLSNQISIREKLRLSAYEQYIIKLIEKYDLSDSIEFLGRLDAEAMKEQFLKADLFLLPSSIENSPNSLGEAMLIGVSAVSADVGGVSELMKPEEEGFVYRWNDVSMMMAQIRRVFSDDSEVTDKRTAAAKSHAMITHDPKTNLDDLMNIYIELAK